MKTKPLTQWYDIPVLLVTQTTLIVFEELKKSPYVSGKLYLDFEEDTCWFGIIELRIQWQPFIGLTSSLEGCYIKLGIDLLNVQRQSVSEDKQKVRKSSQQYKYDTEFLISWPSENIFT